VVEVGGVPEAAEVLGVAVTTVKTHLGRLYGKIGARRRQADLVKVVARFSPPAECQSIPAGAAFWLEQWASKSGMNWRWRGALVSQIKFA